MGWREACEMASGVRSMARWPSIWPFTPQNPFLFFLLINTLCRLEEERRLATTSSGRRGASSRWASEQCIFFSFYAYRVILYINFTLTFMQKWYQLIQVHPLLQQLLQWLLSWEHVIGPLQYLLITKRLLRKKYTLLSEMSKLAATYSIVAT